MRLPQDSIAVEEIYLENFILVNGRKLEMEILEYYPSLISFNKAIHRAPNFKSAHKILLGMGRFELRPNEVTFNSLLVKAPDFDTARGVIADMERAGLRPDEFTFNSLLAKAPDFESVSEVLLEFQSIGVRMSREVTSTFIKKIRLHFDAREWRTYLLKILKWDDFPKFVLAEQVADSKLKLEIIELAKYKTGNT